MPEYIEKREREYQNDVVALFREELGYEYLGNLQCGKGKTENHKGGVNSPIIESEVRAYLGKAGYTQMQIDEAVLRLKTVCRLNERRKVNLLDKSNEVYDVLISGFSIKPSPDKTERDVMLFDFEHFENNNFAIAEEVSYTDPLTRCTSRPDIVLYVNGIALCVIELKRSIVFINEGIRQHLSNQEELIPSFFTTTQFTVVAHHAEHKQLEQGERIEDDMYGFKYGTIGTPINFWCPWKLDTNKTGIVLSDTESFKEFFDREHFMFMFRYGVLSDGGVKKVMRPHQYHALRAAEPRLRQKASGVIWHSQGSGKSLTMVWLALYIKNNFEDPRVIVITDRTELDLQLTADFSDTANKLHHTISHFDLLNTLQSGSEWLISTLIHKFGNHSTHNQIRSDNEAEKSLHIPLDTYLSELRDTIKRRFPNGFKVKGKNIFVFIDECHRTQGGRLHEAMREIMGQDVMLIGFTGTPLLREQKKNGGYLQYNKVKNETQVRFGSFIHKYLHKQAVEDRVILDLQYEARDVEQSIPSKDRLDEKLEEITAGLSGERKQQIRDRWATLEHVYSASERIDRIGYSILDDMERGPILRHDWANAILIAGNIYSAYKYYDFFRNRCSDKSLEDKIAVVTSYNPTDKDIRKNVIDPNKQTEEKFKHDMALQSFSDAGIAADDNIGSADKYEAWAKERFVKKPGRLKLLIVVDKLLTGFDAPNATCLYIDKDMHDHTLFQAICRVNRLGTDVKDDDGNVISHARKEFGLIVDFKHLFVKIENAVTKFNDENGGLGGFDEIDIEGLLEDSIAKNKKRLIAAQKAFMALKGLWQSLNLTDNDLLLGYYTKDLEENPAKPRRDAMYKITETLTTAYDNMADFMARAGFTSEEADNFERLSHEATHINLYIKQGSGDIFDVRIYDPDMRALLDRYLRAEDAVTIVKATADFSFLDVIDEKTDEDKTIDEAKKQANGNEQAAAETIEGKTRAVINNFKEKDPDAYLKFSQQLQQLLDEIHKDNVTFTERMRKLIQLIKEMKKGGVHFPEDITTPLQKTYWNNREDCGFSNDEEEAVQQILSVDDAVKNKARPEFRDKGSKHAALFIKELCKIFPNHIDEQIQNIYNIAVKN